ncbi:FAD-dependent hydroxylase [Gloeocapsa sp. PCC 73106]|uniref:FAD-dependent hydroxylase n=1 Tax=Gloeocapsa sp. PCC 73106 TaxID=102232 RepID=UPI0002ABE29D|nr:FAD-dependent hydroxylase [Gloeocapsa sp. PCC 73106]ELR96651.1 Ubiquinone biosynthesis hydroxylase, UbiH/UbiF/VisC/COQ6 family [Gloeocapsa sp. PCC 73106]
MKSNCIVDYDLAIVGGGIVGVTLACALKNSGLSIVIIEAQPLEVAMTRQRAYALSLLSERIFSEIGVWEGIFPNIANFSQIKLSDADYQKTVKFNTSDLKTEYLGYVAEHGQLLGKLQTFVEDCAQIHWLSPAKVVEVEYQDSQANLSIKMGEEIRYLRTRLVVGADGPKSPMRQAAGIATRGWKYWQSCVTFIIRHEASENNVAFERFWATGPMGILPLPGNRCQIVWTLPHAEAEAVQQLDEEKFMARLKRHLPDCLGKCELIGDRSVFPVQLMQSQSYVRPRLALVGDAAHCCHPVGGQGLNLGIRDAAALAEVIYKAYQQGADIGSISVLKKYESWRKLENLTILGFTDALDRLFSNEWLPVVILRRLGLVMITHIQLFKVEALKLMTGLKGKAPALERSL